MRSVRLPWKAYKQAVMLYMPNDRILTLEYDEESAEFKILALHNFENDFEMQETGKKYPIRGKLRSTQSMCGYLSDDHTWVSIEFKNF